MWLQGWERFTDEFHGSSVSGVTEYSICHMTSENHVIEEPCNFINGRSASWYVTILSSLLIEIAVDCGDCLIVVVEKFV